MANVKG